MERWIEEVEILEEEFRRTIHGFNKMTVVWTQLADQSSKRGYTAYGRQKADMYLCM
jgi:hypothetical protein